MHAILYLCIPRTEAKTSIQARNFACEYLGNEGFADSRRFAGHCDYFGIGGCWSGMLNLLRLRFHNSTTFARFWKKYSSDSFSGDAVALFKRSFPRYQGRVPLCRQGIRFLGSPDDAQIMDGPLFSQLRKGFSRKVGFSYEIEKPNVIFTQDPDDDFVWPRTADQASQYWVVVIDYHC